ncbi:MAG: hypothetical protein IKN57_11490, partial [Parasporobacterium sp.]|nr:hypothetical protein [Parasporobacterium sp.]
MRKRIILTAVLMLMIVFMCSCAGEKKYTTYIPNGQVTVTLGFGTHMPLAPGRTIPIKVTATNDYCLGANTVTLTVPTGKGDYYCYRKKFSSDGALEDPSERSQKDRQKQVLFTVPAAAGSTQMLVEIENGDKNVIYSRNCSYQFSDLP